MLFWQLYRNNFAEFQFFFGQNAEKNEQNCSFFSGPIFPRSFSWKSNIAILTTLLKWFHWKTKFFWLKVRNWSKNGKLFKGKCFFAQSSCGPGKRSFDAPAEIFSAVFASFFCWKFKKWTKCTHSGQEIFQVNLNWTKNCSFENPAEIKSLSPNLSALKLRKGEKAVRSSLRYNFCCSQKFSC